VRNKASKSIFKYFFKSFFLNTCIKKEFLKKVLANFIILLRKKRSIPNNQKDLENNQKDLENNQNDVENNQKDVENNQIDVEMY
jgi:hypothetical protein